MTGPAPAAELPLPTFLIIGAQKSATRWLRHHLDDHPDVFTAPIELSYFNDDRRVSEGLDLYRRGFEGWDGQPVVGESTPGYLMWWHGPAVVAARIDESLPDVRLLAVLRDPVGRAQSALVHHILAERLPPSTRLPEYVRATDAESDRLGIVSGGWYAASLAPFADRFGDRLCVLLHDDVRVAPREVLDRATAHVGAGGGHEPRGLDEVRNSSRQARQAERIAGAAAALTAAEHAEVYESFAADVDELERLIGRDLSAWRRAARASDEPTGAPEG